MTPAGSRLAALVRMAAGVIFIAEGLSKILGDFVHGGFAKSAQEMQATAWPFWGMLLRSVVLPHAAVFAWVVAIGELALGVALLLGLLTRAASAAGVLLMLTILLGQSHPGAGATWDRWITAGLSTKFAILLLLLLAAADAGRVWGFDARRAGVRRGIRR
ncbi:MAG: DoxX family membrane protein [Acidobacteriota bacterium]